jgi:hypothetical protein
LLKNKQRKGLLLTLMFKGKNLIARRKAEENIKTIKKVNKDSFEFLSYIKKKYYSTLTDKEIENLGKIQEHLANMNVLFDSLLSHK